MDLLLWRHAEAEDGFPDETRKLTARGEQQAKQMAKWINKHAPKNLRIIASPATRCQQTAQALGRPFETDPRLATSGNVADLLAVAGWTVSNQAMYRNVLIIGHQPTLGQTTSLLLSGSETGLPVKKGALRWISKRMLNGKTQTVCRISLTPKLLV